MIAKGRVHKFGNDINTDEIIPARYLNSIDPKHLSEHCMEDADVNFVKNVKSGDIIVAGKNFGCGSSREHAPISIKASGVSCVIAESFARIFYRNSINIGLPIIEQPIASKEAQTGDEIEVNFEQGILKNITKDKTYKFTGYPEFMQQIISAGGLMRWIGKSSL